MKFKHMLCVLFAAAVLGRIWITPRLTSIPTVEGTYEAIAHMLVGFLLLVRFYDPKEEVGPSRACWRLGWLLTAWEAGWFLFQKLVG
jgi:hypothetical protein